MPRLVSWTGRGHRGPGRPHGVLFGKHQVSKAVIGVGILSCVAVDHAEMASRMTTRLHGYGTLAHRYAFQHATWLSTMLTSSLASSPLSPPSSPASRRRLASPRNSSRGRSEVGITASQGLLGLNIVMYALQLATKDAVTMLFAKVNPLIASGQYWRLVSPALVHGNFMHLAVNCYSLWNIAPALEGLTGSPRMLVTYFVAAIGGNVASYVLSPHPSLGASGAVFGLGGALAMYFYRNKNVYGRRSDYVLKSLWQTLLINVLYGLTNPRIDNFGHLGGLVGGAVRAVVTWTRQHPSLTQCSYCRFFRLQRMFWGPSCVWCRPGMASGSSPMFRHWVCLRVGRFLCEVK